MNVLQKTAIVHLKKRCLFQYILFHKGLCPVILLPCYLVTVQLCYSVALLLCYSVALLPCCSVARLLGYSVTLSFCYSVTRLLGYPVALLFWGHFRMCHARHQS